MDLVSNLGLFIIGPLLYRDGKKWDEIFSE